jgi:hypothetical protein
MNQNGVIALNKVKDPIPFDELPRWLRLYVAFHPYRIVFDRHLKRTFEGLKGEEQKRMLANFYEDDALLISRSALATYGPDHPQAALALRLSGKRA